MSQANHPNRNNGMPITGVDGSAKIVVETGEYGYIAISAADLDKWNAGFAVPSYEYIPFEG